MKTTTLPPVLFAEIFGSPNDVWTIPVPATRDYHVGEKIEVTSEIGDVTYRTVVGVNDPTPRTRCGRSPPAGSSTRMGPR